MTKSSQAVLFTLEWEGLNTYYSLKMEMVQGYTNTEILKPLICLSQDTSHPLPGTHASLSSPGRTAEEAGGRPKPVAHLQRPDADRTTGKVITQSPRPVESDVGREVSGNLLAPSWVSPPVHRGSEAQKTLFLHPTGL